MSHTPGRWEVSGSAIWARADPSEIGGEDKLVAVVYGDHPLCQSDQRQRSNAALIESAPMLLETVRLLTEKGVKQSTGLGWNKRLRMARDLIEKAEGR